MVVVHGLAFICKVIFIHEFILYFVHDCSFIFSSFNFVVIYVNAICKGIKHND